MCQDIIYTISLIGVISFQTMTSDHGEIPRRGQSPPQLHPYALYLSLCLEQRREFQEEGTGAVPFFFFVLRSQPYMAF